MKKHVEVLLSIYNFSFYNFNVNHNLNTFQQLNHINNLKSVLLQQDVVDTQHSQVCPLRDLEWQRQVCKYPYFDPQTHEWNINTNVVKYFEFENYLNKSHNCKNTSYLIFEYVPRLNKIKYHGLNQHLGIIKQKCNCKRLITLLVVI